MRAGVAARGSGPAMQRLRLELARAGFAPRAMLSTGVVVPALWKLAFALLFSLPIRALFARF